MAYRIRAKTDEQTIRVTLQPGRNVIGSERDCDVCLAHPTVSRHHAVITLSPGGVEIEDLGSRNGTLLRSKRVERAELKPGDIFVIGRVVLSLEEVADDDIEIGINLDEKSLTLDIGDSVAMRGDGTTEVFSPLDRFTLDYLPQLIETLSNGAGRARVAQQVGFSLFESLPPAAAVEVIETEGLDRGVLYSAEHDDAKLQESEWVEVAAGTCQVRVQFPNRKQARHYRPIIRSASMLLGIASRRERERDRLGSGPVVEEPPKGPHERPQPASVVPEVKKIYDQAERVARGDVGVLVFGESGTGKEVLARFIHGASPRARQPLVAINCASLPKDLLEAELFGIERGVATGVEARPGKFEAADQGTLFLDEIGDMAPETQAKILRVLQEQEVFRLGGHDPRPARARIIAATNRPIHKMMAEGTFREDLYHRIATWEVELPPLRHRRADIPALTAHFLAREAARSGVHVAGISRAALRLLSRYRWPGNIRQLQNEIARAVLFIEDGELLDTERLNTTIRGQTPGGGRGIALGQILELVERDEITAALEACQWDTACAAERLEISRPTLYRRLKNLGIDAARSGT